MFYYKTYFYYYYFYLLFEIHLHSPLKIILQTLKLMDFGSSSRFPVENHHRYHHHHQYYGFESSSNTSRDLEQQQQQQEDQEMESNSVFVEREHMFDKVVTPSDVGKLNRLVIPKQHAEKYFPLDSSSNEKGLLLNFEDRCGKLWRFRYSYWTSSQSYVMTKGWSRFVKEKRLDAGDIVSFQRPLLPDDNLPKDHFFIDWRRRPSHPPHLDTTTTPLHFHHHAALSPQIPHHFHLHHWNNPLPTPLSLRRDHLGLHLPQNNTNHTTTVSLFHNNNPYRNNNTYYHHHNHPIVAGSGGDSSYGGASVFYHLRSPVAAAPQQEAVPVVAGGSGGGGGSHGIGKAAAAGKTLRLFGVNMECAVSEESDDECDISTSTTTMSSPQFRIYNGTPMSMPMPMPTNNTNYTPTTDFFERGKSSMSSLDFGTS